jgi:hypothetical protein
MQLLETVNLKNHDHLSKTHCTVCGLRSCIIWKGLGVPLQFVLDISEVKESYYTTGADNFHRTASLFGIN